MLAPGTDRNGGPGTGDTFSCVVIQVLEDDQRRVGKEGVPKAGANSMCFS